MPSRTVPQWLGEAERGWLIIIVIWIDAKSPQ